MSDLSPTSSASGPTQPVRVWDLPTRLFHWLLVGAVVGLVITGNVGGNAMVWHFRLGVAVGALLLFRLVWGLVGGRWSRFASFIPTPGKLLRYLRGQAAPQEGLDIGHSPTGALSVFALLALLLLQVGTGLFSDNEIDSIGPLNQFVSGVTAQLATSWHKGWGKTLLLVLVGLHIAAIIFYAVKKKLNLVGPMVHGDKMLPAATPASRDGWAQRALALVLLLAFAALARWVLGLGG
jgi:cytochrome b